MASIFRAFFLLFLISTALAQELCYPDNERVDCHPDPGASRERCLERGCMWCLPDLPDQNYPDCFFPKEYGYAMVGEPVYTDRGVTASLTRITNATLFGGDAFSLTFEAEFQSNYRLRIKITDEAPRFEVPIEILPPSNPAVDNTLYQIVFSNSPSFSFKVLRRATGTTLFDSALGGFIFSNQFIQLSTKLPSRNLYGIGENEQHSFRHHFERRPVYPLYADGGSPMGNANNYGVHPHYTVLEEDGNVHAVAIINSSPQEFEVHPYPGIVYRTIGGLLDLYFFLGPGPEDTVQQWTEAVGRFPLPPYWSLGFHLCRFGYDNMENLTRVVDRMIASEIPFDVQYGDIDIMDRRLDFTVDPVNFAGLNDYVKSLKSENGIRFITILDPCISIGEPAGSYEAFELGQEMDVWVKKADGSPVRGRMWPPDDVYFPDYAKNETREWWKIMIKKFHDEVLQFDALWIDMNEPASFVDGDLDENGCLENTINNPPYMPKIRASTLYRGTLCPEHRDAMGLHYNTHNLYGWAESEPTMVATTEAVGRRTFILSRSTYLGSGRWTTHWLGDNFSRWSNLHYSIIGMLQFNLFGMPFVGPDICGHQEDATVELCARWMQLGAFYPFSRNHNAYGMKDQDPAAFDGEIIDISKKAMMTRYALLPYLYTLLALHSRDGSTVARPLWHEFPTDYEAGGIDRQFLWGSGLLISPVIDEGATSVHAYLPDARWYDFYTGREVSIRKNYTDFAAELFHPINLHLRGGVILPAQDPAVNTDLARRNNFRLFVSLDDEFGAEGVFYYDAGDNLDVEQYFWAEMSFSFNNSSGHLNYTVVKDDFEGMGELGLEVVRFSGLPASPAWEVKVNGEVHQSFEFEMNKLQVNGLTGKANANLDIELTMA